MNVSSKIKEYLRIAAISIVGSFGLTYFTCESCLQDYHKYLLTSIFSAIMWFAMWIGNSELTQFISKSIPWVKYPLKRLIIGVISTVVFTSLIAIALLKSWEYSRNIRFNSYWEFISVSLIITFLISLFLHSREFLLQWRQTAVEAERYQKQSISAQYESLKNQVNPHFLFNSLNALTNLVYEDQDKAAKFIKQLSEVYRYVLDTREKEVVALEEEVKFAQSYIYLQEIRFGSNLKIDFQLSGVAGYVAPLALQLLLENAIKHNIISRDEPLRIGVFAQNGFVHIKNNLQRKSVLEEGKSGIGLDNIRSRYRFLTDREVIIEETSNSFLVKLPIIDQADL